MGHAQHLRCLVVSEKYLLHPYLLDQFSTISIARRSVWFSVASFIFSSLTRSNLSRNLSISLSFCAPYLCWASSLARF
ncbi:hypothetical protein SAMN04487952_108196 [Halomonas caseinilytica]|nr:hypothetical protein SAMN04487952_108196 [Halomonas caseinilytica]